MTVSGCAAAAEYACPAKTRLEGAPKVPADGVWSGVFSSSPIWLSGVSLFDGPPAELASLKPDSVQETKGDSVFVWKLTATYPAGIWISCRYGDGLVSLAQRVATPVSACRASTKKDNSIGRLGIVVRCE